MCYKYNQNERQFSRSDAGFVGAVQTHTHSLITLMALETQFNCQLSISDPPFPTYPYSFSAFSGNLMCITFGNLLSLGYISDFGKIVSHCAKIPILRSQKT